MLTRVLPPRGATVSVGRHFATSVPRWNVPTSVEGAETAPFEDADAIKAKHVLLDRWNKGTVSASLDADSVKAQRTQVKMAKKEARAEYEAKADGILVEAQKNLSPKERAAYMDFALAMAGRQSGACAAFARIHRQYTALTAEQSLPYEEKAAANFKVRFQGLKATPYGLFVKENYKQMADSMPAAPCLNKSGMVIKALATKYNALNPEERAVYKAKAVAIRAEAHEKLSPEERTAYKMHEAARMKVHGPSPHVTHLFTVFVQENYKQTAESMPGANGMVLKALAAKYKALSEKERAVYKTKADGINAETQKNLIPMERTAYQVREAARKRRSADLRNGIIAISKKERAVYKAKADDILAEAQKNLSPKERATYMMRKAAANFKVRYPGLKATPCGLFVKENYKQMADSMPAAPFLNKSGMVITALATKYNALSPEERAVYKAKAVAIRAEAHEKLSPEERTAYKMHEAARMKVHGPSLHVTHLFTVFVKENYKQTADTMRMECSARRVSMSSRCAGDMVFKALAAKYKALSEKERAVYKAKADGINAEAQKNLIPVERTAYQVREAARQRRSADLRSWPSCQNGLNKAT